jgi:hypothetical protein
MPATVLTVALETPALTVGIKTAALAISKKYFGLNFTDLSVA